MADVDKLANEIRRLRRIVEEDVERRRRRGLEEEERKDRVGCFGLNGLFDDISGGMF